MGQYFSTPSSGYVAPQNQGDHVEKQSIYDTSVTSKNWKEGLQQDFYDYNLIRDTIDNGQLTFDALVRADEPILLSFLPPIVDDNDRDQIQAEFLRSVMSIPAWCKQHKLPCM